MCVCVWVSVFVREEGGDRPTVSVFYEPQLIAPIGRREDLERVDALLLLCQTLERTQAADDHIEPVPADRRRRGHEGLLGRRLEHAAGPRRSEGNLLRVKSEGVHRKRGMEREKRGSGEAPARRWW